MMQSMMGCGPGSWLAAGVGVLILALLALGIAGLAKHLFFSRGRGEVPLP